MLFGVELIILFSLGLYDIYRAFFPSLVLKNNIKDNKLKEEHCDLVLRVQTYLYLALSITILTLIGLIVLGIVSIDLLLVFLGYAITKYIFSFVLAATININSGMC
jgi:hypothetical protein